MIASDDVKNVFGLERDDSLDADLRCAAGVLDSHVGPDVVSAEQHIVKGLQGFISSTRGQ